MTAILLADIHLSVQQRDEHRWKLFPWLLEQKADDIVICGDLTGPKDHHPAKLVNRLADGMAALAEKFRLWIIPGNHDSVSAETPFFRFLKNTPNINFMTQVGVGELSVGKAMFVPASTKWDFKPSQFPYLFTHATFSGAKAENGQTMTGVDPAVLSDYEGMCYAGDIHKPQRLRKNIVYIGAPYHCRFGDDFEPRLIKLLNNGDEKDLFFPAPRKLTLNITKPEDLLKEDVDEGDQVKVRCYLRRPEYVFWKEYRGEIREIAEKKSWVLCSTEVVSLDEKQAEGKQAGEQPKGYIGPQELVAAYAKRQKASKKHLRIGQELLDG